MERQLILGSICLSDIPRRLFKKVVCKDGKERTYLNIKVVERKEPSKYGHTHFFSCAPKKEEQVNGESYICGDGKLYEPAAVAAPTPEQIAAAPAAQEDDLPF